MVYGVSAATRGTVRTGNEVQYHHLRWKTWKTYCYGCAAIAMFPADANRKHTHGLHSVHYLAAGAIKLARGGEGASWRYHAFDTVAAARLTASVDADGLIVQYTYCCCCC